ncbi:carbon dioxide concentrating mechanism protein [Lyngbya aestuarii]|uniref:carbon dioxide concentrating mechanism protein n=1 Tax=Lyngbya aestuarii TaxID=118322 RepID=UPI00403D8ABB
MHLPTLPLVSNYSVHVEGDVSIDPSAAIAPGVILHADPDSRIVIGAGVCIGMGTIFHAHQGTLEVEAGAILGSGTLVVGKGKIGANACIGSLTTILDASVEPQQVVPAASVVGNQGRSLSKTSQESPEPPEASTFQPPSTPVNTTSKEILNGQFDSNPHLLTSSSTTEDDEESSIELQEKSPSEQPDALIHGQGNLNRLLKTLFPYNNPPLSSPPPEG